MGTCSPGRAFNFMRYRDIEYQVVQTANPTGWKWTVQFDDGRTRTGSGVSRTHALGFAQRAIDKGLSETVPGFVQPSEDSVP